MGTTTKTSHYWRNREGSLLLQVFKGEHERLGGGAEGLRKGRRGVSVFPVAIKPERIINRVSPASLSF